MVKTEGRYVRKENDIFGTDGSNWMWQCFLSAHFPNILSQISVKT